MPLPLYDDDDNYDHRPQVIPISEYMADPEFARLPHRPQQRLMRQQQARGYIGSGIHIAGTGYDPESPLATVLETFRNWFHFPDAAPIVAALGAVAGHMMPGSPAWLMLVGQASCGKTEVLMSTTQLQRVVLVSELTVPSLLSGTSSKDVAKDATGGVLREIGDSGVLLFKEFNSVLNMERNERNRTLSALREVYDGEWSRPVGGDGGRRIPWKGKASALGACTPVIDNHHAVMTSMGERFLFFRFAPVNGYAQSRSALENSTFHSMAQQGTQYAVKELFASITIPKSLPYLEDYRMSRMIALANLIVWCRAGVERDPYKDDITALIEPEAPARVSKELNQIFQGMLVIGVHEAEAWRITCKIALDSMPAVRIMILKATTQDRFTRTYEATVLAEMLQYPLTPIRRALEDMEALRMFERDIEGKTHHWRPTATFLGEYHRAFPKHEDD